MPANIVLSENTAVHLSLAPVADALSGTVTTAPISCKNARAVTYLVSWGVGATGTTLITVEACDDTTPTNVSAIAFKSRRWNNAVATNAPAALTARTSSGFTTTAGSNQVYEITVDCDQLANSGYGFVRLKAVEQTDSPILAQIMSITHLQNPSATPASVLS